MADRPNNNPTEPQYTGGWHTPSGARRVTPRPTQQPSQSGWKVVNKLPEGVGSTPKVTGGWHLPNQAHTSIRPDEKMKLDPQRIEAAEAFRPEDMLLLPDTEAAPAIDAQRPEEMLSAAIGLVDSDADTSVETTMAETESANTVPLPLLEFEKAEELVSDSSDLLNLEGEKPALETAEEDDDAAFSMSELIALQSLVEQAPPASVVPTATSATGRDRAASTGEQPAVEATGAQPAAEDPAAVARQKLQELGISGTGAAAPVAAVSVQPAADDPAAVARQKVQELERAGIGTSAPALVDSQPIVTQDLAARFRATEENVRVLRTQHQNGLITRDQLQEELRKLMILDDQNVWWMMGVETDTWYRFQNNEWIVATPPYGGVSAGQKRGAPPTVTSGLDASEVVGGSLPYFPTGESPAQVGGFGQTGVEFGWKCRMVYLPGGGWFRQGTHQLLRLE